MSIDMNTHGREIRKSVDEVISDSGNDWCILGYEGKTYTLKVVAEGDGGLAEMQDEFHGSKIMYGYCRVIEPNTGLPKFVFINWQGEGAPERMKFACGSHSLEVQRICRTKHVTVNARDESDVDPDDIVSRVVKASGSQHSILKTSPQAAAPIEPVAGGESTGSVYKKVNPAAEILNQERDAYWQKIEADERRQKAEEERRKRQEKDRQERELRERELVEAQQRERRAVEHSQKIAKQRSVERQAQMQSQRKNSEQDNLQEVADQEQERRQRSESLKNERQAELQALIAQRNASGLAPSQKIGTKYQRVDPRAEIESSSRDEYWQRMEAEERERKEAEKRRRVEEASAQERARMQREEDDKKRREQLERDRASAIAQQRMAERQQAATEKQRTEAQAKAIHQEAIEDERERQSRSERMRRERQEEAARLIRQRSNADESAADARNYFQQRTTSTGAAPRPQQTPPALPTHAPVAAPTPPAAFSAPAPAPVSPPAPAPAPAQAFDPPAPVHQLQDNGGDVWNDEEEDYEPIYLNEPPAQPKNEHIYAADPLGQAGDVGMRAEALYDYEATEDDEVGFNPGDILIRIEKVDEGWWMGENSQGHRGLFPANYVRLLE